MLKRLKEKSNDEKIRNTMNKRISFIFGIIVFIFAIIVLRLGYLQIAQGSHYKQLIKNSENLTVNEAVPRGRILDRNGKVLVDNASKKAITYARGRKTSQSEVLKTAEKLSKLIKMDTDKITDRDKQDYWIQLHPNKAKSLMKNEQVLLDDGNITQDEYDDALYKKVGKNQINSLNDKDLQILAIYREMMSGSALDPQTIKNEDVSDEEYAAVSLKLSDMPGVNTTMDWDRKYLYGDTLRGIFGDVSTTKEGIPKELTEQYLAKGYSRNDRVGKSYLEYQYDDILKGKKKEMKYTTDKSGEVIDSKVINPGSRGDDLVLSIDIDLQKKTEEYLEKQISKLRSEGAKDMDNALIVVQNPNNGDILAMAGKQIDKNGDLTDYDIGTFTSQYAVGSSVKGGTLLAGYQNNAIKVGEEMIDEPLKFAGGLTKHSYFNQDGKVRIDDKEALMHSSNVYMFKTALKLAGSPYTPNMSLPTDITSAGQKLRKGLNQVGLGVKTGIDLPNETNGQIEPLTDNPGNYLDLAIGQYDTYTPMQLSQYVSTIGNNGYRVQPHVGLEIRKATNKETLGPVKEKVKGQVLNKVNNTQNEVNEVQEGFKMAFNEKDGTGYQSFKDTEVPSAGKTGTAEVFQDGEPRVNSTYIGYAPIKNPQLAFSIVYTNQPVPEPWLNGGDLGRDVINYYFKEKSKD
ncbi:peptidoglycan D,D-transpeptidase FtsI family protein [Staphylococcus saprophyticus]|uniref:peptidoglycan D,D-transpeptidase FtsI family protein n=1 Tax=Staphylococcus saprophyticus TaxID=29385 RepID=UPI0019D2EC86|nr:penicillin-binding protein 2 [Staphylococcus saprophyticus]MBN6755472.1 penicillin-binding protein 2 [Staphylococcus saprophyticus]MBN6765450.1 penicillin-binding protein 2 [Staphylococcus saprophyticus]MBN6770256.1 penicillin-binding protein 2 [Staphylococcus saprophyticus]MBN6779270.1 penicillin-binding protein 2 [Staphylococcus saprophyticus]MBN6787215.1 penicillin-binding protein 2 [Staphylococcus saprophyticus]